MLIRKNREVSNCCEVEDSFLYINSRNGWDTLVYCVWCKSVYVWYRGCFNDFFRNKDYPPSQWFNKKVGELSNTAEKLVILVSSSLNKSNIMQFCKIKKSDIKGFAIYKCIVGSGVGCPSLDDFGIAYLPYITIKGLGEIPIGFELDWFYSTIRYNTFEEIMEQKDRFKEYSVAELLDVGGFYDLDQARTIIQLVKSYLKGEIKFKPEWKNTGWHKCKNQQLAKTIGKFRR